MAANYEFTERQGTRSGTAKTFLYTTGNACESIMLPILDVVSVQLSFDAAGTAKVQATIDTYDKVDAGTASWVDWDSGDVTATTQANCHKVTAVRVYRTSGDVRLTVAL